jgi:hypothetical protein
VILFIVEGKSAAPTTGGRKRRPLKPAQGKQHTRRPSAGWGGLLVGVMLQSSVPLRMNWLPSPATGLRDGPIVPQVVSTMSATAHEAVPAVEMDEQLREEPELHELHDPHDPGV